MIIKFATCLLALSVFTACETTSTAQRQTSSPRQTLAQRTLASNSGPTGWNSAEPAPPAEGPEDIPAEPTASRAVDPAFNPGLLPTPLLRGSAASGL